MDIDQFLSSNKLLVLEIGANEKPQAQLVPEYADGQANILTIDIDEKQKPDIVGDAAELPGILKGELDGIFASHVLEHFSYWRTGAVLKNWYDTLKDGGMLHVAVPSWEWSAREILSENPSPALYGHSFAGQVNEWDVHMAMFTMRRLRSIFEKTGFKVIRARTGVYHLQGADGKTYEAEQHYVCGVKGAVQLSKE